MRHIISYSFILIIFILGCKTLANSQTLSANDSKADEINYHYNYDTSEEIKSNLYQGWIDTFSIDNRKFRINLNKENDSIDIEYLKNGIWIKNVSLEINDEFDLTTDLNHDGYKDIYSEAQGWNFVNYYIPQKRMFSKQYQMLGDGEYLVDSSRQLYVNYREPYHQCNNYNSQLLDYKNVIPKIYFLLSGETYTDEYGCVMDSIKIIHLYQYDDVKDTLILLNSFKPHDSKKFDYDIFWKRNYKKLMGYR